MLVVADVALLEHRAIANADIEILSDRLEARPAWIAGRLGLATPNLDTLLGLTRLFAQSRGLFEIKLP